MRLLIVFVFPLLCWATWLVKEDKACDPREEHVLIPYTGFSLQRQFTLSYPPLHHVRLTHCDHGKVDMEAFALAERGTDMVWATNMCISPTACYRAVRRKKYVSRDVSLYIPHIMVGGLFLCPGSNETCTNENAKPVLPLLADRYSQQWLEFPHWKRIVQRVPSFYTPDFLDPRYPWRQDNGGAEWAQSLDINEEYSFTPREQLRISHVVNIALKYLKQAVTLNPKYIFWERDIVYDDFARDAQQGGIKSFAALYFIRDSLLKHGNTDMANKLTFLLIQLETDIDDPVGIVHASWDSSTDIYYS